MWKPRIWFSTGLQVSHKISHVPVSMSLICEQQHEDIPMKRFHSIIIKFIPLSFKMGDKRASL